MPGTCHEYDENDSTRYPFRIEFSVSSLLDVYDHLPTSCDSEETVKRDYYVEVDGILFHSPYQKKFLSLLEDYLFCSQHISSLVWLGNEIGPSPASPHHYSVLHLKKFVKDDHQLQLHPASIGGPKVWFHAKVLKFPLPNAFAPVLKFEKTRIRHYEWNRSHASEQRDRKRSFFAFWVAGLSLSSPKGPSLGPRPLPSGGLLPSSYSCLLLLLPAKPLGWYFCGVRLSWFRGCGEGGVGGWWTP